MDKLCLTLFITGQTLRSQAAVTNMRRICQDLPPDQYELIIVDVLERPQVAEEARVIATPMLVKTAPAPVRRIVGDLSDKEQVSTWIGVAPLYNNRTQAESMPT